jgi:hypothetical protein
MGITAGVVLTIAVQYGWRYYHYYQVKDEFALFEIAKQHVEQQLIGARVLDVVITPQSSVKVNYMYDKLYDVHLSYERNGKIKQMETQYGFYRGTWITPNTTQLEILDSKANVIQERK